MLGDPQQVADGIAAFVERHSPDELMLTANLYDHRARLRSFELAMGLARPPRGLNNGVTARCSRDGSDGALPIEPPMADTRAEHIAQLAELIKDVEVAMFTTTGVDGRLYSRPLATQQVTFDGDLWFVITADSPKVAEIALDPHVNVAYASPSKNTYVSVAGRARIVDDRAKTRNCGRRR